jgi:hypothetical protein
MFRNLCLLTLVTILLAAGCSNSPTEPVRTTTGFESPVFTFQLAMYFADPSLGLPERIPVDVPTGSLISSRNSHLFASYALSAFDVYYEPADWDDWVTTCRWSQNYEPADWDDWMSIGAGNRADIRRGSSVYSDLIFISKKIDPMNQYEPADWDDWLTSGNYEPADWDDWLTSATLSDIAALVN